MEDIKKIQEFFSKPLNENKVTKEDFDKVVKILSKSKYPFTIMLVPKWDEIDIITGQDSPDEISDDISQRLDSAGLNWGGNSGITISGDSSNYSRREYSDIFKVNGGHKDYYEESVNEERKTDPDAELKVGDYQTKYFYICPGAKSLYQDIEDKVEDMGLAIRAAKLQDALFAIEASALESGATEAEVFAAQSIADQIMAMAAMMGLDKEHSYIQGHVDKIKGAVGKEQVDEGASTEEKRMAMQAIKRFAKYRGVSEKEAKADLIRAVKELGSIEEAINEIVETIQAGKVLEEKLCKKGEAYRKRRMAAGEKSSAYLSGRAVKVCKGQISGRKKRKKRKSKK